MTMERAVVVKVPEPGVAEVEMRVGVPGGHDCCGAGRCASSIRLRVMSDINVRVGDEVVMEDRSAAMMAAWGVALVVPLALAIVGYAAWVPWGGLLGLVGLACTVRRMKATAAHRMPRIVSLSMEEPL